MDINASQPAEAGIASAIHRGLQQEWLTQNGDALDSSNRFVDTHGLPLQQHRNF